jgi:tight adherence protein B
MFGIAAASAVASILGVSFDVRSRRRRRPRPRWLVQLEAQGVPAGRLIAASAAAAGIAFALIWAFTGSPLVASVPAAIVAVIPTRHYQRQSQRRAVLSRQAWPDAVRMVLAGLEAGRSLNQALVDLARSGPEPLRPAFARYVDLAHPLGEIAALEVVRVELADRVADGVIHVLKAASQKGARVVLPILQRIADEAAADVQLDERIQTARSEQDLNAWGVFILPWAALVIMCAQTGPFRDFYSGTAGVPVLVAGSVMSVGGMLIVRRLARLPDEPRVLAAAARQEGQR